MAAEQELSSLLKPKPPADHELALVPPISCITTYVPLIYVSNVLHSASLYHPNTVYQEFPVTNSMCLARDARPSHLLFWPLYWPV